MKVIKQHIETSVVSGPPGTAYGPMYSMHRYWSKKSPEVVSAYIEHYTNPGDIVLDPFCGSGITACEAVRLGRRAITIDLNPVATFITRTTLAPVNLSRLKLAFSDIRNACEDRINRLFRTTCSSCGKGAVAEFVVRERDAARIIAFKCGCSEDRLFKNPDNDDQRFERLLDGEVVPHWYPSAVRLPPVRQSQCQYVHELFTRRNLIALSMLRYSIESVGDLHVREVLRLAFSAALDKCSRLMPLSPASLDEKPTLRQGWIALRFYTPPLWQEVNPWFAFERSFQRVYAGKQASNDKLRGAIIGSRYADLVRGKANVLVLDGSADEVIETQMPKHCVDYVLTDPPFADHIQYLALSTLWGSWLGFKFQYDKELVVAPRTNRDMQAYENRLGRILSQVRGTMRAGGYIHLFWEDVRGPYLHKLINLMGDAGIATEKVVHQPPPSSFAASARKKDAPAPKGSYVVRGRDAGRRGVRANRLSRESVRDSVAESAKKTLTICGGSAQMATLLHSIYQKLDGKHLVSLATEESENFLREAVRDFAVFLDGKFQFREDMVQARVGGELVEVVRKVWLDALSLYMNEKKKGGNVINRVSQSVLYRLQGQGLTMNDVAKLGEGITEEDIRSHRRERLTGIIRLFGQVLGHAKIAEGVGVGSVAWEASDGSKVLFDVAKDGVAVRVERIVNGITINSNIGNLQDADLERALLEWCDSHQDQGEELRRMLFPVGGESRCSRLPKQMRLLVKDNRELVKEDTGRCPGHFLITLHLPDNCGIEPGPGQFFHIICDPDGDKTLGEDGKARGYSLTLRRPLSTHRIHYRDFDRQVLGTPAMIPFELKKAIRRPISKIDFLYKVVGVGTRDLSRVRPGTHIEVIGPLGNGFNIEEVDVAVIVAGGIGVAPLVALAERLRYLGARIYLYLGALRRELLRPVLSGRPDSVIESQFEDGTPQFCDLIQDEFKQIGADKVVVCTDDASEGRSGFVAKALAEDLRGGCLQLSQDSRTKIYACGPHRMLKAVSVLAGEYGIPCEVLLEERMACGIGACLSCTCRVKEDGGQVVKRRVCADGPVFRSEQIVWPD